MSKDDIVATLRGNGFEVMAEKRHRYLVLLNETGRSVGIVTFRDIAEYFDAAFAGSAS